MIEAIETSELPKWWDRQDIQQIVKTFSIDEYKEHINVEDIETIATTLGLFENSHICKNRTYTKMGNIDKLVKLDLMEQKVNFNEVYYSLTQKCLDLLGITLKFDDKGLL
jgi:hypothetical protein